MSLERERQVIVIVVVIFLLECWEPFPVGVLGLESVAYSGRGSAVLKLRQELRKLQASNVGPQGVAECWCKEGRIERARIRLSPFPITTMAFPLLLRIRVPLYSKQKKINITFKNAKGTHYRLSTQ